jgi:hypothetical protein
MLEKITCEKNARGEVAQFFAVPTCPAKHVQLPLPADLREKRLSVAGSPIPGIWWALPHRVWFLPFFGR